MKVAASIRRANLWLFIGLVVFAIALCALVLLWMRSRTHALGGKVYPPTTWRQEGDNHARKTILASFCHPERSESASAVEG